MSRRRKPDPMLQKFRNLARSGQRREAVELLQSILQKNPNHTKARDELSRYLTRQPFSFEEADYAELQKILSDYRHNPQLLTTLKKAKLKRLRERCRFLQQALPHMMGPMEQKTMSHIITGIARELHRRRPPIGKFAIIAGSAVAVIAVISGTAFYLWQSAEKAADKLESAAEAGCSLAVAENLLKIHDTGLNRTLNRRVGIAAEKLRGVMAATAHREREVDALLRAIEQGEQKIVHSGLGAVASIERKLKELQGAGADLQARWAAICKQEQDTISQQRLSLSEELMSPLPPRPAQKLDIKEDRETLLSRRRLLQERIMKFDTTADMLQLDEKIIAPAREELKAVDGLLADIEALKNMLELLPAAHDYATYRNMLSAVNPGAYQLSQELLQVRSQIPTLDNMRGMMQEHGQNLPPGLLQAARKSLMEGGPSFTKEFPASKEQLHLLDELLTNTALSTRLYELTYTVDDVRVYSEEEPSVKKLTVRVKRSRLDPEYSVAEKRIIEWYSPKDVFRRVLDPRPLYTRLGLGNRTGFATTANLPSLITKVFQTEGKDIPPLARAYVLSYLLRVNSMANHAILNGMRFAPTMRATAADFEKMVQHCNIKLDGSCWLIRSRAHEQAERDFARWFDKHRDVDYAAEVRQNMSMVMSIQPRFCGYINEHGQPVLFESVRNKQLIWYLSTEGAMTATAHGDELQAPVRLSPVFTMEKKR